MHLLSSLFLSFVTLISNGRSGNGYPAPDQANIDRVEAEALRLNILESKSEITHDVICKMPYSAIA